MTSLIFSCKCFLYLRHLRTLDHFSIISHTIQQSNTTISRTFKASVCFFDRLYIVTTSVSPTLRMRINEWTRLFIINFFCYYQFLEYSSHFLCWLIPTSHLINLLSFWISGENFFHCEDVKLISLNFEYLGWSLSFKSSNFKRSTWLLWLTMNRLAANIERIVVDNDHFLLHVIGVYFPWI